MNRTMRFILGNCGRQYGISRYDKLKMVIRILKARKKLSSFDGQGFGGVSFDQHLAMVEELLSIPESIRGDVVECGSYNGGSTIPLSIACSLTQRRLFVCDCFKGIPEFTQSDKDTIYNGEGLSFYWGEGEYASSLTQTKKNIETFGEARVCNFIKGYFDETLKNLPTERIVMVFEDADLPSSVRVCLKHLWSKLQDGCRFFSHEANVVGVVSLFYDSNWWRENLHTIPPGFYSCIHPPDGSGHGSYSGLGFAMKHISPLILAMEESFTFKYPAYARVMTEEVEEFYRELYEEQGETNFIGAI